MKLYHGSNVAVEHPRLLRSDRRLDFGPEFYCTSSFEQASRWATLAPKRRKSGRPIVSVYDFDETISIASDENDTDSIPLKVLTFDEANEDWLRFVSANRHGEPIKEEWDLVVGPVANDTTMPVLRLFFMNVYSVQETINRLLPQNLRDQYAFCTDRAIQLLRFEGVMEP